MANEIFLKLGDLKGDALDSPDNKPNHKDEISVIGWSWGMTQTGTTHLATGGGAGKVSVHDISFTKRADPASNQIHQMCCSGKHFDKAVFTMRKAGGKPVEFMKIELHDIIISSVNSSIAPESETFVENVSLNFAKFKLIFTPQDKDGNPTAEMPAGWHIPENGPFSG